MARDVWLSDNDLVSEGGRVARSALAYDDELFFVERETNFATAATTYTNVTGMVGNLTVPDDPFVIEAWVPLIAEEVQYIDVQIADEESALVVADRWFPTVTSGIKVLYLKTRVPYSMHEPLVGESKTYRLQMRTGAATSDATIFVDFFGRVNPCWMRASVGS